MTILFKHYKKPVKIKTLVPIKLDLYGRLFLRQTYRDIRRAGFNRGRAKIMIRNLISMGVNQ